LQDENYKKKKKKKPRLNGHSTKYKKLLGPKKMAIKSGMKMVMNLGEQWQRSVLLHSSLEIPLLFNQLNLAIPRRFNTKGTCFIKPRLSLSIM
jgi:hypothetical protein